jgi:predicted RNA-binding protein Jag
VHLALAEDPDVETESEGDGFLKRVAVKLKAR